MIGLLDELEDEVAHASGRVATEPEGTPAPLRPTESPELPPARPVRPARDPSVEPFAKEARALIEACEAELSDDAEPQRAARLHYEVGRLYETPLRDLRRAAAHYQEALSRAPEHMPTIRGTRRVLLSRKSYQTALPLFDAEVRVTPDAARKASLYYAKGRLLEDVMGDREQARKAFTTALDLDRGNVAILKAVEQCERAAESWGALDRTFEREANAVSADPRHRAALIVQRAHLVETRRNEVDAAIELYETALRLDGECHSALSALKRLHHTQRRWRDLIRVLEHEAAQSTDPSLRAMALYRVGRLHEERLGNTDEALCALERAAEVSPDSPLVLEKLAKLYESSERWQSLAEVLQRLVAGVREPNERLGMLSRIARLFEERLDDAEAGARWYEAVLGIQPTSVPTLQALGKLYKQRGAWDALIRMHLAEADATDDPRRRAAAYALVADVFERQLGKPAEAAEQHKRALGQVPGYPTSFKALCRLLSKAGRWRELVELYERTVDEARSPDQSITYLLKIGAIYEDALGEAAQAAHACRRVLTLDPNHLGAIHALQRTTEEAGRHQELVEALELEAEKTNDETAIVALLHRAGEVLDERLGDQDAALGRFRKVLGIDPTYVPALISLGRIYYRAGRWDDLLDMYERQLEVTPRGTESVTLLLKMGELCEERIGRDEQALALYRRAVDMSPTNGTALKAVARKLRERGDWADLVKVLEVEHSGQADPGARARTALRVGELYEEHLGQPDRATAAYEQALKAVPGFPPAADALSRVRSDRKAWHELVGDLGREAATTHDPAAAISALMRQAEVWAGRLGEPRRAIACLEETLRREPAHVGALLALEPLYRSTGTWEELGHIYETEARVFADTGARIGALRELARLQAVRGEVVDGDPRDSHEAVLGLSPSDPLALESLEELALERGDRVLLGHIDLRMATLSADPSTRASYLTRLAESQEGADQTQDALDSYRAAVEADPDDLGATRGLSRLAERLGDPTALAEAARREANVTTDKTVAARLLVKSATVRSEGLGDREGALLDLERALELSPDHAEAAERLSAMMTQAGQEARLADLLARAAGSATSSEREAALWMEVARIQGDLLDNLPGAISSLNRVLRSAPSHITALRRLADLYERDGQWTESVQLLSRVVQLAPDREVLRNAHLQLAALWDARLGETSRALVSLQAVLALDADNPEALRRLSDLQEREGKVAQAAETAQRLVAASKDPAARATALLRVARIERRLGNDQAGHRALLESVALEGPGSESALELKSLITALPDWDRYAGALASYLEVARREGDDLAPTYLELARVRHDHMNQPNAAVDLLCRGLTETQGSSALRKDLTTRLRLVGRHAEAIDHLRVLLDEDLTRADAWRNVARSFDAMHRGDETRLAVMPLAVLGTANRAELRHLEAHAPRPAQANPGSLDADVLGLLGPQGRAEAAVVDLLRALAPALCKLYPADLEAFGLSTRDRMSSRQGDPLRSVAERIATIMGVEGFDLFVHRMRNRGVALELGNPPSLIVPSWVAELPETQQVFLLGKPLCAVAMQLQVLEKLTPRELEVLVASAARNVVPGYGAGLTSEDILEEQARRMHKTVPRRARKGLEELIQRYVEAPKLDFVRWSELLRRDWQRVAAVLSDDLTATVDAMQRSERELSGMAGPTLVQSAPAVSDVLRFWVSETALNLRRRSGMIDA